MHPKSHCRFLYESASDPLVGGTDPKIRIRIRTKMSRIPNSGEKDPVLQRIITETTNTVLCSHFNSRKLKRHVKFFWLNLRNNTSLHLSQMWFLFLHVPALKFNGYHTVTQQMDRTSVTVRKKHLQNLCFGFTFIEFGSGPRSMILMTKKLKKLNADKKIYIFIKKLLCSLS